MPRSGICPPEGGDIVEQFPPGDPGQPALVYWDTVTKKYIDVGLGSSLSVVGDEIVVSFPPSGAAWGSITGTLSAQADLQTALDAKQNALTTGTAAEYFRGDLSLGTFPTDLGDFTNSPGYITAAGAPVQTVSNSDGTLTISPTTGAVVASLNLSHANSWAAQQTFISPIVGTQATTDNSTKGASTAYVTTAINNAIAGINPAVAVQAATTTAANTSGLTYNNGAAGIGATFIGANNTPIVIDGFTFAALGQRLLIKNDTQSPSGAFNGVYYVTQVQTAILPPILTRAIDYDQPSDINNTGAIPVINGAANGTTSWVLTSTVNTVGTDPLAYTQFSLNPANIAQSVSNADGTLTISPTVGAVVASLALGNPNAWSALQTFGNNISFGGKTMNVSSLASGDNLQYNGTNWVNKPSGYTQMLKGTGSIALAAAGGQSIGAISFSTAFTGAGVPTVMVSVDDAAHLVGYQYNIWAYARSVTNSGFSIFLNYNLSNLGSTNTYIYNWLAIK